MMMPLFLAILTTLLLFNIAVTISIGMAFLAFLEALGVDVSRLGKGGKR